MDKKQELETRINQNEIEVSLLNEEKKRLEAKMKELDKPKLRHGDYFFGHSTDKPVLVVKNELEARFYYADGTSPNIEHNGTYVGKVAMPLGNIFDDIAERGKELEEFSFDVHRCYYDKRDSMKHAPIHIAGNWHPLSEAEEIHRKLGYLLNKAKNKKD